MCTSMRLTGVFKASEEVKFDDCSRFVFFSDCHRGDSSKVDDFAPNKTIYSTALDYYYTNGYTYIEIGDGDELWENDRFSTLLNAHKDVYLLMRKFHIKGRLYLLWGNHDIFKRSQRFVRKNLFEDYNPGTKKFEPLFNNIRLHEGLTLRYKGTPHKIFVVHGHQGDIVNDTFWPISRFFVRYILRNFELLHRRNPFSPARSISRMNVIKNNILRWIKANNQMIIAGHTHHTAFARPGEIPYFNDGCCVHDGWITCIEIKDSEIMLVKWSRKSEANGQQTARRDVMAGPEKIQAFFN